MKIGSTFFIGFVTEDPATGAAVVPDALPVASIYEQGSLTALAYSPTVAAKSDLTGAYHIEVAATLANGFEVNKTYEVYAAFAVSTVARVVPVATIAVSNRSIDDAYSGAVIIPPLSGTVTQSIALSTQTMTIVRGDTPRLTFALGGDRTGWTPYFAARVKTTGRYTIDARQASWIDATIGTGFIDLLVADNLYVGTLEGEIEIRSGDERQTALKWDITVIDDVVKG